jgi:hypothetical protein
LEKESYIEWIENENSDSKQIIEDKNIRITCFYTPTDYIILKEINNNILKLEEFTKRKGELSDIIFFQFIIKSIDNVPFLDNDKLSEKAKLNLEEYFRYEFQNTIGLVNGKSDTEIKPEIYHMERNYGISPEIKIIFGFSNDGLSKKFSIKSSSQIIENKSLVFDFDLNKIAQLNNILL